MIPVLHPADSTSWTSFGVGALTDAISCNVTEERNGIYELELTYPISGQHYADIENRMIILAKPNFIDAPQPFRIYKISKPLNGVVTIDAQHISYDLSGFVDGVFQASGVQAALLALTANCTPGSCPFTFTSDMSEAGSFEVKEPTSIRALMGGKAGSLLTHWAGEWHYDKYVCSLDANRGTDRGVTIRYGKNLTSLKQEENIASVYTGIFPFYHNADTGVLVTLPEKVVNAPGTYSYTKICPVNMTDKFQDAPTESQLRDAALAYIANNDVGIPSVNLQLSFVQDEIRDRVDLCDTVHVYFDALGVSAAAKCIRTVWDVLADRYSKIELGSTRASIAGTIASIQGKADEAYTATSTLAETAQAISEKITGQLGGYVVMNDTDNDGEPDEILIMDSPSKETAVNVIRMNNGGIAFSQDGYDGTYGTAWSIDGQFVADYITSGVLQANLIRILGTTNFYWDAGNIYIINPNDSGQQIRIGQYDGTHYGIGFTRDSGVTWQTALDFQGLNVQATGFSKTYVSLTPPDPADYGLTTFNTGDVWVESERRYTWNEVAENTWSWAAQHTWEQLGGATEPNMYTWNGGSWQKIYDGESFTSFDTRLTIAEQEIAMAVASVASKGVTYIQLTDPRNDSGIQIHFGDHWIKAEPGYSVVTWDKAATMTWSQFASTYDWNATEGPKEYAWDGYEWVLVSDHGAEVRHSTAIIETDKEITAMATAQSVMNSRIVENTAQLTIQANQIASEVAQRVNGETQMSSRITQNAQSISAEVTRATGAEGELSSRITQTATEISAEVSNKYDKRAGININADSIEIKTSSSSDTNVITLGRSGINIGSSGSITITSASGLKIGSSTLATELGKKSSVASIYNQYYQSTSPTTPTGGSWQNTCPAWVDGKYIFMRTVTTYSDGSPTSYSTATNITGAKGATGPQGATGSQGAQGVGVSSIETTYALGISGTTAPSSGWSTTVPAYRDTYYYWTRTITTYSNGTSTTVYVCENGMTYSCEAAYTAAYAAISIANGTTSVPHVVSSGLTIDNGDLTLSSTNHMYILSNSQVLIGSDSSNSAVLINKNGISIASGKNIAVASGGTIDIDSGADLNIKSGGKMTIKSGAGLDVNSNGAVTIKSGGAMDVNSGGKLNINSSGAIDVNASGNLNINSDGKMTIKSGGKMELNSGGNINIKSGGTFTVSSNKFSIDSSGNVSMQGSVTATSGYIGNGESGFTIKNTAIYNGRSDLSGSLPAGSPAGNGIYVGTNGISLGTSVDGPLFKVTSAGVLTAKSATITGTLTAGSVVDKSANLKDGNNRDNPVSSVINHSNNGQSANDRLTNLNAGIGAFNILQVDEFRVPYSGGYSHVRVYQITIDQEGIPATYRLLGLGR